LLAIYVSFLSEKYISFFITTSLLNINLFVSLYFHSALLLVYSPIHGTVVPHGPIVPVCIVDVASSMDNDHGKAAFDSVRSGGFALVSHRFLHLPVVLVGLVVCGLSVYNQYRSGRIALTAVTNFSLPLFQCTRQCSSQASLWPRRSRATGSTRSSCSRFLTRHRRTTAISLLLVRYFLQPRTTTNIC
jgi:hypothetical protein